MTDWLKHLEQAADKLDQAHAARDQAIVDAARANVPRAHIAKAVRVSRTHVHRLINDAAERDD